MKNLIILKLLLITICYQPSTSSAQEQLSIGDRAPIIKLTVYSGKNGSVYTQQVPYNKGRWLVLDFWSKTCKLCIQSFPKVNQLAQQFSKEVDFLLIGTNESKYNKGIEEIYSRLKRQLGLKLDYAFDVPSHKVYVANGYPHVVIIDPSGNIAAITYGTELTEANLSALLAGKKSMALKRGFADKPKIASDTLYKNEVLAGSMARSSILTHYNSSQLPLHNLDLARYAKEGKYQIVGASLERLYMIAYLRKGLWSMNDSLYVTTWPRAIVELRDKSPFVYQMAKSIGLHGYAVQMVDQNATIATIQMAMQTDLSHWFGYQVRLEERSMPILMLRFTGSQLPEKSSATKFLSDDPSLIEFKGIKTSDFLQEIKNFHQRVHFEDASGIGYPIDLRVEGPINNLDKFSENLKKTGFELIKTQKKMKVLVISDR